MNLYYNKKQEENYVCGLSSYGNKRNSKLGKGNGMSMLWNDTRNNVDLNLPSQNIIHCTQNREMLNKEFYFVMHKKLIPCVC